MTETIFTEDAYAESCEAEVVAAGEKGVVLDRTVFYATSGGQPGDTGALRSAAGREVAVIDTVKDRETGDLLHVTEQGVEPPAAGDKVRAVIDWGRRHRHMRMHTCLHLICAILDSEITGASVGSEKGRIDLNLAESPDKEALGGELNRLIGEDHPVTATWISDQELAGRPELVRTMSVKPPSGLGRVRLISIEGVDLQPCGGTHVGSTAEIGRVRIGKIENKGRRNRRINVLFDE